mmetsp:Transcript_30148/g.71503  ORF Transcript_30148/g.71503 Transcript_30148/m.71503 type:complete len:575 (-) Transcript_30148:94-1818(-)
MGTGASQPPTPPMKKQPETVPKKKYDDVVKKLEAVQKELQALKMSKAGEKYPAEMTPGKRALECPVAVMTDSYKATHPWIYPEAQSMEAYGEFRARYKGVGADDDRFVFYGIRHCIENLVSRPWTVQDVEAAEAFYSTHNVGNTPYPFPKDLFLKFVRENGGHFPVKIQALPEGSVCYVRTPTFIVTAEGEYSRLVTFLETLLDMVWYPSCVATLSRYCKDLFAAAFAHSVDDDLYFLLDSRLHDFGFRGCTCVEQSVLGGAAHLLNFGGSDTMSACYHVQYHLNAGRPVGTSIPATEHSVMTAWPNEEAALLNEIELYGTSLFACVMDSYDYDRALNEVLPAIADAHRAKGGLIVLRPDSGDPTEQVIKGLRAGEKVFGCTYNSKRCPHHTREEDIGKGYKVLNNCAVIQGDGINYKIIKEILDAVHKAGYSAINVTFGMGGALLQKMNRDTMSFATKLCHIIYADGTERDVMKTPKSSAAKISLPGRMFVGREREGAAPIVLPKDHPRCERLDPVMQVVYNKRPIPGIFQDFDSIKARVQRDWAAIPPNGNPISPELQEKVDSILKSRGNTV